MAAPAPSPMERPLADATAAIRGGELPLTALTDAALDRIGTDVKFGFTTATLKGAPFPVDDVKAAVTAGVKAASKPATALAALLSASKAGKKVAEPEAAVGVNKAIGAGGALAGVPFFAAPCFDVAGRSATAGTEVFEAGLATEDAAVIAALKREGAIFMGQSSMSPLNRGPMNNPLYGGAIKNPASLTGCAGGAQGGAAAAVAGRVVPFAVALDSAGDVRVPASLCGVVGWRPTEGRYEGAGTLRLSSTLETIGVVAKTVADVQLVDAVLASGRCDHVAPAAPPPPPLAAPAVVCSVVMVGEGAAPEGGAPVEAAAAPPAEAPPPPSSPQPTPFNGAAYAAAAAVEAPAVVAEANRVRDAGTAALVDAAAVPAPVPAVSPLAGLRVGVFPPSSVFMTGLDPRTGEAWEAFLGRLKAAGADVTVLDAPELAPLSGDEKDAGSLHALAAACAPTLLGYEAMAGLGAYLRDHVTAPPKPKAKAADEEEGGEEEEEDADAAAAAAVAAAPTVLELALPLTALVPQLPLPPPEAALLTAQLKSSTAVSITAYTHALQVKRAALIAAWDALFAAADVVLYPATPAPALPLYKALGSSDKGVAGGAGTMDFGATVNLGSLKATSTGKAVTSEAPASPASEAVVLADGSVVPAGPFYGRNALPASVAGLPCLSFPCGLTKPTPSAPKGSNGAERLPVGLEVVGPRAADEHVLAVGRAMQGLQSLLNDPIALQRWRDGVTLPSSHRTTV